MTISRKNHIINSGGSANMSADVHSDVAILRAGENKVSFHIKIDNTDSAVGVIKIQESNDVLAEKYPDNADWVLVTFNSGSTEYDIADGTDMFHIETYAKYLRVWYDFTSGDGILDVFANIVGGM